MTTNTNNIERQCFMESNNKRVVESVVVPKLSPGDKVMICLTRDVSPAELQQARMELIARFPDVEFVFVSGVASVAVLGKNEVE